MSIFVFIKLEVIPPQIPLRLPCYDLALLANMMFDTTL